MKIIQILLLIAFASTSLAKSYRPDIELFIDSTKRFSQSDIAVGKYDSLFYPIKNGYTTSNEAFNYVLKFYVHNELPTTATKWVSNYQTIVSKRSVFYLNHAGEFIKNELGYLDYGKENTSFPRPNFPVIVPAHDSVLVYLHTESIGERINLDVDITSDAEYRVKNSKSLLFHGIFYGVLLFILLVNILYYGLFKDLVFIIYSISVLLAINFYTMFDGLYFFGFAPHMDVWYMPIALFGIIFYFAFLPIMAFFFLRMNNGDHQSLWNTLKVYIGIVLIALVIPFFNHSEAANQFYFLYYTIFCGLSFILLIVVIVKGRNIEPYLGRNFLIANGIYVFFAIIPFFDLMDGFDTRLGVVFFKIGAVIELTILSFTLAVRFKRTEDQFNLVQLEHMNLQEMFFRSQINPHFLFNVLGSINSYINNNDKENASTYLLKFSKLIRLVLESTKLDRIVLRDELEMIRTYVELEQLRNDNFDFEIRIDKQIDQDQTRIPAMLVQPYIENAVKHGLRDVKHRGTVNLSIDLKGSFLVVRVEDNGIGIDNSKAITHVGGTKIGMKNVRNRIQVLKQKLGIDFEVISFQKNNPEHGTVIILKLPIN